MRTMATFQNYYQPNYHLAAHSHFASHNNFDPHSNAEPRAMIYSPLQSNLEHMHIVPPTWIRNDFTSSLEHSDQRVCHLSPKFFNHNAGLGSSNVADSAISYQPQNGDYLAPSVRLLSDDGCDVSLQQGHGFRPYPPSQDVSFCPEQFSTPYYARGHVANRESSLSSVTVHTPDYSTLDMTSSGFMPLFHGSTCPPCPPSELQAHHNEPDLRESTVASASLWLSFLSQTPAKLSPANLSSSSSAVVNSSKACLSAIEPGRGLRLASKTTVNLLSDDLHQHLSESSLLHKNAAAHGLSTTFDVSTASRKDRSKNILKRKAKRALCNFSNCTRTAQTGGLCRPHGGGSRCKSPNCGKYAQKGGYCSGHGGGRRCQVVGCPKGAQAGGRCVYHGGGKRCKESACTKLSQKEGYCSRHFRNSVTKNRVDASLIGRSPSPTVSASSS